MAQDAVAVEAARPKVFAFVFPMASGHLNPSLPLARALVDLGHRVHYLCHVQMRAAIEDTGAEFHSNTEVLRELYETREPDLFGALASLRREHDLPEGDTIPQARTKLRSVQLELMLPGVLRWLRELRADAVAYCPMLNTEAAWAAKVLRIPSVALLTLAGPGSLQRAFSEIIATCNITEEQLRQISCSYEPRLEANQRIKARFGLEIPLLENLHPLGKMDVLKHSFVTLVTTCADLQDPVTPEMAEAYQNDGARFEAVGALLDKEGAKRAAGHKFKEGDEVAESSGSDGHIDDDEVISRVRLAKSSGRQVVLVSMGTVITGDSPDWGWEGRRTGNDGKKRGLTGRELCRAAWAGAFEAFGAECAEDGPLMIVALGPQRDALGEVRPPVNAICLPVLPQVDILKAGVDIFLTHGGQNSFTEALSSAVPLVVCPGFGDQPVNGRKAEALGVGLCVPRPDPEAGLEAAAAAQYRRSVASALKHVLSESSFAACAARCAERLQKSGGVPRAVEWMLAAAASAREAEGGPCKVNGGHVAATAAVAAPARKAKAEAKAGPGKGGEQAAADAARVHLAGA